MKRIYGFHVDIEAYFKIQRVWWMMSTIKLNTQFFDEMEAMSYATYVDQIRCQ